MTKGPVDLIFTTPRLRVRRLTPADFEVMFAAYRDPEAMRFVDDGLPISRADCERWVGVILERYRTHGYGMSVAELVATDEVTGFIGLVHPGGQPEPELKYTLLRAYWGRGYATELARGMMNYARDELNLAHVISTVDAEHSASQRVLAKAGFRLDHTRPNDDGHVTQVWTWRTR